MEQIISIERMENALSLFGSFDENVKLIEQHYKTSIVFRGTDIKINGDAENTYRAAKTIESLLIMINNGETINEQNIHYAMSLVDEGQSDKLNSLSNGVICINAKGRPLRAKTLGQKKYVENIQSNTITIGIGPAGTGKTYLAVAMAVKAFRAHEINRIILTRPA
ncbi:MAG: PhoH family protein, partial [Oscillospiraceae bacterium]